MKRITILLSAFFALSVLFLFQACKKDSPVSPGDSEALSNRIESAHFIYLYSSGDVKPDTMWQEKYYTWLVQQLAVTNTEKYYFYKYKNQAHLKKLTGKQTNGFAEPGTVNFHTIWEIDNHEFVHSIFIRLVGHPPALFNEGIAVANQATYNYSYIMVPGWNGQDFNQLAKNYKNSGTLPSLETLLGYTSFWNIDANITYPVAGSFTRYLITTYGIDKFKSYASTATFQDNASTTRSLFQRAYNIPLDSAWAGWNGFIGGVIIR